MQLFSLDSTNVGPEQWQQLVHAIRQNYDAYDGFVIAHGTDTMAYTAAALSYMIQNSAKPVVLTGSQKSIYNRDTDARNNLYRTFLYASSDFSWGVQLVFDNKVILGTRRPARPAPKASTPFPASTTPRPPCSGICGSSPFCAALTRCRLCSFTSSWTPPSSYCGWCLACGRTSSRC